MKLTTRRLKILISESIDRMSKIRELVASGEEGYHMALELALVLKIPKEEVEKIPFQLPYGQRPKWALRLEIKKVQEGIKNSTNERERYELQQYLEGLEEELYDY
jgi:hypothetical protein